MLEQVPAQVEDGFSKFARALASTDYVTRDKGLQALTRWLTHKPEIAEQDMLKICKGIFYCFWHSDKAPVQEDLAQRLAQILPQMKAQVGPGGAARPTGARARFQPSLCTSHAFIVDE